MAVFATRSPRRIFRSLLAWVVSRNERGVGKGLLLVASGMIFGVDKRVMLTRAGAGRGGGRGEGGVRLSVVALVMGSLERN